ncbi:MAG TPA: addiction module protein [Mucilaginibacter sp.]|jgi:putative addiction module component (TIGR02574 family)
MSTETIREKLHNFIDTADDKKVEAIYTLVEDDIEEVYDHWEDEEFVAEIKSRIDDFESGKDKGLSWEEVKTKARTEFKAK